MKDAALRWISKGIRLSCLLLSRIAGHITAVVVGGQMVFLWLYNGRVRLFERAVSNRLQSRVSVRILLRKSTRATILCWLLTRTARRRCLLRVARLAVGSTGCTLAAACPGPLPCFSLQLGLSVALPALKSSQLLFCTIRCPTNHLVNGLAKRSFLERRVLGSEAMAVSGVEAGFGRRGKFWTLPCP